jgi:hypothetical protein
VTACAGSVTGPVHSVSEGGDRWYVHPLTGERFISVTTVLSTVAKPFLERWAAAEATKAALARIEILHSASRCTLPCGRTGRPDACEICVPCWGRVIRRASTTLRDRAAQIGTRVHNVAENLALGFAPGPDGDDPQVVPFITQFRRWWGDFQPTFQATEATVINREHGYAGTLDGICTLGWCPPKHSHEVGTPRLIDYKTGKSLYGEAAMQMAAYRRGESILMPDGTEHPMIDTDGALLLHLRPDNYKLHPVLADKEDFEDFLHVLRVWQRTHQGGNPIGRAMTKPRKKVNDPNLPDIAPF